MKSKAGNKLKKIRRLALAAGLTLTGCITEPKPKPVEIIYRVDSTCFHQDTTTRADSTAFARLTCHIHPSDNPTPPGP